MITAILWFIIVCLVVGFWLQHREIGLLTEVVRDQEQQNLKVVWMLKRHLINEHKAGFGADAEDAEIAEVVG